MLQFLAFCFRSNLLQLLLHCPDLILDLLELNAVISFGLSQRVFIGLFLEEPSEVLSA